MDTKNLFEAAIRVLGLYYIFRGFNDLAYVFFYTIGATDGSVTKTYPSEYLIYGAVYFFGGLYLLRGGAVIVDFAFPAKSRNHSDFASEAASQDEDKSA